MSEPLSLEVAICQRVHRYEWYDNNGHARNGSRAHACQDCQNVADVAAAWFDGRPT